MRHLVPLLLTLAACGVGEGAPPVPASRTDTPAAHRAADTAVARRPADTPAARRAADTPSARRTADTTHTSPRDSTSWASDSSIVRALYVNRWASQSESRMRDLIRLADSTEINGLVIDIKDEFGLNFDSPDTVVSRNAGNAGRIPHLRVLLDTLAAHHIVTIARIVVFKDSVAARVNPQHTIRKADGTPWRDKKGMTWVDPYDHAIWEYNIRVAEEVARLGFKEVQFDYIRFPEPYKSLPTQVFKDANGVPKPQALGSFFKTACPRVHTAGARCTADIFGLVTTVPGALEVGQQWETLAPVSDVLLPMVYPSHYPHGSFGIERPNAEPYKVIVAAISRAHERDRALGITSPAHVRPWLQAFSLKGMQPKYGAHELEEQKRAAYDAGSDDWVMWNPGSLYEPFVPGLEKTMVSRRKGTGTPEKVANAPKKQ